MNKELAGVIKTLEGLGYHQVSVLPMEVLEALGEKVGQPISVGAIMAPDFSQCEYKNNILNAYSDVARRELGKAHDAIHSSGTETGRIDSSKENVSNTPKSTLPAVVLGHIVHGLIEQVASLTEQFNALKEDHEALSECEQETYNLAESLAEKVTALEETVLPRTEDSSNSIGTVTLEDKTVFCPEFNEGEFYQYGVHYGFNEKLTDDQIQGLVEDVAVEYTEPVEYAELHSGNTLVFKIVQPNGETRFVVAKDWHEAVVTEDGHLL